MQGTRSERDPDLGEHQADFTDIKTTVNSQAINCSICNRTLYTDRLTFDKFGLAMEEGLDNPFTCDNCVAEFEELTSTR